MIQQLLFILVLSYIQSVSFSIISRARNRNSIKYHIVAASASNTIWFLTFRVLVLNKMDWTMFIPYTLGTVAGSVSGAKISMWIERQLMATSDEHLKRTRPYLAVTNHSVVDGLSVATGLSLQGPFKDELGAQQYLATLNLHGRCTGILLQGLPLSSPSTVTT